MYVCSRGAQGAESRYAVVQMIMQDKPVLITLGKLAVSVCFAYVADTRCGRIREEMATFSSRALCMRVRLSPSVLKSSSTTRLSIVCQSLAWPQNQT